MAFKISRLLPAITLVCALGMVAPVMAQTATTLTPLSTMAAPTTATKLMSNVKLAAGDEFKTKTLATAHCPDDTVVWTTFSLQKSYHLAASKYYGKTKHGAYVCQKDAIAAGFHAAKD